MRRKKMAGGLAVVGAGVLLVAAPASQGSLQAHRASQIIGPAAGHTYGGQMPHNGPFVEVRVSEDAKSGYVHASCGAEVGDSSPHRFTVRKDRHFGFDSPLDKGDSHPSASIQQGVFHTQRGLRKLTVFAHAYAFKGCSNRGARIDLILDKKAPPRVIPKPVPATPPPVTMPPATPPPTTPPPTTPPGGQIKPQLTINGCPDQMKGGYLYHPANTPLTLSGVLTPSSGKPDPLTFHASGDPDGNQNGDRYVPIQTDASGNWTFTYTPKMSNSLLNPGIISQATASRSYAAAACKGFLVS